jgi:hypothetical protein
MKGFGKIALSNINRLTNQKKEDFLIDLKLVSLVVDVQDHLKDCTFVIEWKRGPESQSSKSVFLTDISHEEDMND